MSAELLQLSDELGMLFDVALSVEPAGGVNDAWAKVLTSFGVAPVGPVDRARMQGELGMARGALPIEVASCVNALVARRGIALDIVTYWRELEPTYLQYARYRPKSMFAHAIQTARDKTRASWARPPSGYIIRCSSCGGPRLSEELACNFCGREAIGT
ncbi:MAG TPA: hypothetical protein VIV11_32280 [Kofleriaceae bacterium]